MVAIENLDGIVLVPATLRGRAGRDTAGTLVLDTGAGALALDRELSRWLGLTDAESLSAAVEIAARPLARLSIGPLEWDQVAPTLLVNADLVRRAIDRSVLGLLGGQPLARGAVIVDHDAGRLAILPAAAGSGAPDGAPAPERGPVHRLARSRELLAGALSPRARPIPFRIAGDGKILVPARLRAPRVDAGGGRSGAPARAAGRVDSLTLIVDTGATKCVLFEDALRAGAPELDRWPSLRGLSAPTLFGAAPARVVRLDRLELGTATAGASRREVDAVLLSGPLAAALERVVGEPVHGLVGYSFFEHHRIAIDYTHQLLWLDPPEREVEDRPFEYSQPGIQIERAGHAAVVAGVVTGSAAERAGVAPGDTLLAVGALKADSASVLDLARALEGPPGTRVRIRLVRGTHERTVILARRRLL